MEPWVGPASIAVSDGVQIGAVLIEMVLDCYVTSDDRVILPRSWRACWHRAIYCCQKGAS